MIRTRVIIAALALAASAGVAGAQQPTPAPSTPRAAQPRDGAPRHGKHGKHGKNNRAEFERASLRGVDLTDAQKAQLRAMREKYKAEAKPIMERLRPSMQDARAARQKGDTAAARAAFARTAQDREALKALFERQRTESLGVLTPEQRAKVEANRKEMKAKHEARAGKRKKA